MEPSLSNRRWKHRDDYVKGSLGTVREPCGICGQPAITIRINELTPPAGILKDDRKMILNRVLKHKIGVTCGCYARGHRQYAHVVDRMKG